MISIVVDMFIFETNLEKTNIIRSRLFLYLKSVFKKKINFFWCADIKNKF
jgi:hypothetical protein